MRFTGKNLELVLTALSHAVSDVQMHIGSCPDVFEYAEDIAELEIEQAKYERLWRRVNAALLKEREEQ
jgi:hypothetical protein